jgi:hypothetical protein
MSYSLSQAATATGKDRSTIQRAIKSGKISAGLNESGAYEIDPAELHRVFPPVANDEGKAVALQQIATGEIESENRELRARVELLREMVDDLRRRLDGEAEERRRLTHLLTHEPRKSSDTPQEPRPHWPHWWKVAGLVVLGIIAAVAWNARQPEKTQPQKQPAIEPKPQAPIKPPEPWKPDDNGG